MRKKKYIMIFLFIVLVMLFLLVSLKFFNNIKNFKEHKDFFKQPISEQRVEDWMSFMYIEKNYNLDVNDIIGIDMNVFDKRNKISTYCQKNKINCTEVIDKLNAAKKENIDKHGN